MILYGHRSNVGHVWSWSEVRGLRTLRDFHLTDNCRFLPLWGPFFRSGADLGDFYAHSGGNRESLPTNTYESVWYGKDEPLHLIRDIPFHRLDIERTHLGLIRDAPFLWVGLEGTHSNIEVNQELCDALLRIWVCRMPKRSTQRMAESLYIIAQYLNCQLQQSEWQHTNEIPTHLQWIADLLRCLAWGDCLSTVIYWSPCVSGLLMRFPATEQQQRQGRPNVGYSISGCHLTLLFCRVKRSMEFLACTGLPFSQLSEWNNYDHLARSELDPKRSMMEACAQW